MSGKSGGATGIWLDVQVSPLSHVKQLDRIDIRLQIASSEWDIRRGTRAIRLGGGGCRRRKEKKTHKVGLFFLTMVPTSF